jgi:hypothetical protein
MMKKFNICGQHFENMVAMKVCGAQAVGRHGPVKIVMIWLCTYSTIFRDF